MLAHEVELASDDLDVDLVGDTCGLHLGKAVGFPAVEVLDSNGHTKLLLNTLEEIPKIVSTCT